MALLIEKAIRRFVFDGEVIEDPGSDLDPDGVREFLANAYPALTNADTEGPVMTEEQGQHIATYTFTKNVGKKG